MKDLERLEMQVRSGYYQKPLAQYRSSRSDDQSSSIGETTSYQSPTSESSTSRRSSISSKRHVTIAQDIPLAREPSEKSRAQKLPYPESQSQFVHPSGQVSFIPSIPYKREIMDEPRVALTYSHEVDSSYDRQISTVQSHSQRRKKAGDDYTKAQQSTEKEEEEASALHSHTFYEGGPNFRHSWTEGEQMTHIQSYPRERGLASNRSARLPARKTGLAGIRPPQIMMGTTGQYSGISPLKSSEQVSLSSGTTVRLAVGREETFKEQQIPGEVVGIQYIREVPTTSKYVYETGKSSQYDGDRLRRLHSLESGSQASIIRSDRSHIQERIEEEPVSAREEFKQQLHMTERIKQPYAREYGRQPALSFQQPQYSTLQQQPHPSQHHHKLSQHPAGETREYFSTEQPVSGTESPPEPLIISGGGLPEGTKRFVVDKFTVTFTERDEEDTLI